MSSSEQEYKSKYPRGRILQPCVEDMERRIFELEKTVQRLQLIVGKSKVKYVLYCKSGVDPCGSGDQTEREPITIRKFSYYKVALRALKKEQAYTKALGENPDIWYIEEEEVIT